MAGVAGDRSRNAQAGFDRARRNLGNHCTGVDTSQSHPASADGAEAKGVASTGRAARCQFTARQLYGHEFSGGQRACRRRSGREPAGPAAAAADRGASGAKPYAAGKAETAARADATQSRLAAAGVLGAWTCNGLRPASGQVRSNARELSVPLGFVREWTVYSPAPRSLS